uniref:Uncharacterized protein n=1 Tax=Strongyloides papillosus TaxID=174720 RepID=A0A0N5C3H0_STREA
MWKKLEYYVWVIYQYYHYKYINDDSPMSMRETPNICDENLENFNGVKTILKSLTILCWKIIK